MNEKWPRKGEGKKHKTKRPEDDIVAGFEDRDRVGKRQGIQVL